MCFPAKRAVSIRTTADSIHWQDNSLKRVHQKGVLYCFVICHRLFSVCSEGAKDFSQLSDWNYTGLHCIIGEPLNLGFHQTLSLADFDAALTQCTQLTHFNDRIANYNMPDELQAFIINCELNLELVWLFVFGFWASAQVFVHTDFNLAWSDALPAYKGCSHTPTHTCTGHFHSSPWQMGQQGQHSSMASHLVFTDK